MTGTTATIEGRPIAGEINKGHRGSAEQWDAVKFLEMLDAVFAIPTVISVMWEQYTPYFNDGDTCEFTVYGFQVEVSDPPANTDPDYEETEYTEDGETEHAYFSDYSLRDYDNPENNHPAYAPLDALDSASRHFETTLYEYFGDHAQVIATRDGFRIQEYSHD